MDGRVRLHGRGDTHKRVNPSRRTNSITVSRRLVSYNRAHRFERLLVSSFREHVGDHELRADQVHRDDQLQDRVFNEDRGPLEVPRAARRAFLGHQLVHR